MATIVAQCFLICFGLLNLQHPYFISVTEIEYVNQDKEIGISCKIFTDDFEMALRETFKTKVDLIHPADKKETGKLISNYISSHLQIKADGKAVSPVLIGFEQEEEATWCYFSVANINSVKKIEINNSILYDFKKEQVNMMHVTVNGNRKSSRVINPDTRSVFEF
jgi:hypothetical protein